MIQLRLSVLLATLALASCGEDPPRSSKEAAQAEERAGASTDISLDSEVDGAAIAFTVHEPARIDPMASYAVLLHSHGYGGSRVTATQRQNAPPPFAALLEAGYAIVSVDLRGHGDSGGTARLLDPAFEGADALQLVDWIESNLPWAARNASGRVRLGGFAESYGGGFLHLVQRLDPSGRLAAFVADITWHDLRRSLFESQTFKSSFGAFFAVVPVASPGVRPDPLVTELLATGVTLNMLRADQLEFLRDRSLISACEAGTLPPADVLYTQSAYDTLFSVNEALDNVNCQRTAGGDARLWVKSTGHGVGLPVLGGVTGSPGQTQSCGALDRDAAMLAWFEEKLRDRPGAASAVPQFCFQVGLDNPLAIIGDRFPEPETGALVFGPLTMTAADASDETLQAPLLTLEAGGVLAGAARMRITIADPTPGAPALGDPILFITLGRAGADGTAQDLTNALPVRGFGTHEVELPATFESVTAGESIVLLLRAGRVGTYAGAGSRIPTPAMVSGDIRLPQVRL